MGGFLVAALVVEGGELGAWAEALYEHGAAAGVVLVDFCCAVSVPGEHGG